MTDANSVCCNLCTRRFQVDEALNKLGTPDQLFQFQINPIGRCFALPCYSNVCGFAPTLGLIWKRSYLSRP